MQHQLEDFIVHDQWSSRFLHCTCFSMLSLATFSDPCEIQVLEKFFIVFLCFSHCLQMVQLKKHKYFIFTDLYPIFHTP